MDNQPFWLKTYGPLKFPKLDQHLRADVVVIGGGIAGLTAAYLLLKERKSIVLLERTRLAQGETGCTTAHITYVTDERMTDLVERFGPDHAQATWDAGLSAMEQIQAIVREEAIECELANAPGFLVAAHDKDTAEESEQLQEEARLISELGFDATFVDSTPVFFRPGVRVANQLKFHPAKYLMGLAQKVVAMGGMIFEESEVTEFEENPLVVKAGEFMVQCEHVVIATHVPLQGLRTAASAALLQTKLALYSTYAIGAEVPKGVVPEMMWWDTADPYLYLRAEKRDTHDYVILGGEDHKTGQETDTELPFRRLLDALNFLIPEAVPTERWSSRVVETVDGLPYIGPIGSGQFLGTGFAGNGMTFGTLTGMMACDHIMGRRNPWVDLFSVDRKTLSTSWDYVSENKDYPYYLLKGRLAGGEKSRVADLKPGEGKVLRTKQGKVAACRLEDGTVHVRSAVCPHMGCIVNWNAAEKSWDCPCHGSRFQADGKVFGGPAESSLEEVRGPLE
jgi:glycine/D-amino acid oxidase-like deaminating enzyme/nitrite reductase/ring-hydroxylating ferredoxin subunit